MVTNEESPENYEYLHNVISDIVAFTRSQVLSNTVYDVTHRLDQDFLKLLSFTMK